MLIFPMKLENHSTPFRPKWRHTLAVMALAASTLPAASLKVDTSVRHQTIEGFGASINGWSSQMIPVYSEQEFLDFVVDELGLSMFRMQVWPRVLPQAVENWEDISYEDFVWTGSATRGQVNNDFAIEIRERNPEIRIIGTIWSPPPWMKENNSLTGTKSGFLLAPDRTYDHDNRLKDDLYQHYAKFLVEYQKYLIEHGIGLYAFGPQNEPMFTQQFESNLMSGPEFARLVRTLGAMYEHEGVERPLIYGPEDMTMARYYPGGVGGDAARHNPYVDALMEEDTAKYFDIWATHGYSDGVNAGNAMDPAAYWNSIKQFGRPYWITEGGTGGHDWPTPITNGVASHIHHALTGGNVSAFVSWQITDGERSTHGLMHMREKTKKTYATMHYWRFIRPGAVRVDAGSSTNDVRASAYTDYRNHQLVIVAINNGPATDLDIEIEGDDRVFSFQTYRTSATEDCEFVGDVEYADGTARIMLPANSITTLVGMHERWVWHDSLGPVWDAGDHWVWHDVLGWTYMEHDPVVYTAIRGWQYITSGDYIHGLYTYDFDEGWMYTAKAFLPMIYSYEAQKWRQDVGM